MTVIEVNFKGYKGNLARGQYPGGNLALVIMGARNEMIAIITANLPNLTLPPDQVAVKTYSENEGILDALLPTGIFKEQVGEGKSGYCTYPIYKVNMDLIKDIQVI